MLIQNLCIDTLTPQCGTIWKGILWQELNHDGRILSNGDGILQRCLPFPFLLFPFPFSSLLLSYLFSIPSEVTRRLKTRKRVLIKTWPLAMLTPWSSYSITEKKTFGGMNHRGYGVILQRLKLSSTLYLCKWYFYESAQDPSIEARCSLVHPAGVSSLGLRA